MTNKWFGGTFCPRGATCSLEAGAISPTNGPKLRTMDFAEPQYKHFLGEVMQFYNMQSFEDANADPRKWVRCEGQLMPISQYEALFSILGASYGGDGRVVFGVPDFRNTELHNMYINVDGFLIN